MCLNYSPFLLFLLLLGVVVQIQGGDDWTENEITDYHFDEQLNQSPLTAKYLIKYMKLFNDKIDHLLEGQAQENDHRLRSEVLQKNQIDLSDLWHLYKANISQQETVINDQAKSIESLQKQIDLLKQDVKITQASLQYKENIMESQSFKIETTERELKERVEIIEKLPKLQSCLESGIALIEVDPLRPFLVQCIDDGWMVIQKRFNGSQDFYKSWNEYRDGFGHVDGEHFIGLERLYRLTKLQQHELYVRMEDFDGSISFANYDDFALGSEEEQYELKSVGSFTGNVNNSLVYNLNQKFSTYDRDNDELSSGNCAKWQDRHGGWWYKSCTHVNLNGFYYPYRVEQLDSMYWYWGSLKSVEMLIRPKATIELGGSDSGMEKFNDEIVIVNL